MCITRLRLGVGGLLVVAVGIVAIVLFQSLSPLILMKTIAAAAVLGLAAVSSLDRDRKGEDTPHGPWSEKQARGDRAR